MPCITLGTALRQQRSRILQSSMRSERTCAVNWSPKILVCMSVRSKRKMSAGDQMSTEFVDLCGLHQAC